MDTPLDEFLKRQQSPLSAYFDKHNPLTRPVAGFIVESKGDAATDAVKQARLRLNAIALADSGFKHPDSNVQIVTEISRLLHFNRSSLSNGQALEFLYDALLASDDPGVLISALQDKNPNTVNLGQQLIHKTLKTKPKKSELKLHIAIAEIMYILAHDINSALKTRRNAAAYEKKLFKGAKELDATHPYVVAYDVMRSLDKPDFNASRAFHRLSVGIIKHPDEPRLYEARTRVLEKIGEFAQACDAAKDWAEHATHSAEARDAYTILAGAVADQQARLAESAAADEIATRQVQSPDYKRSTRRMVTLLIDAKTQAFYLDNIDAALDILDEAQDQYPGEAIFPLRYADVALQSDKFSTLEKIEFAEEAWRHISSLDWEKMDYRFHHISDAKSCFYLASFCLNREDTELGGNFARLGLYFFPSDEGLQRLLQESTDPTAERPQMIRENNLDAQEPK